MEYGLDSGSNEAVVYRKRGFIRYDVRSTGRYEHLEQSCKKVLNTLRIGEEKVTLTELDPLHDGTSFAAFNILLERRWDGLCGTGGVVDSPSCDMALYQGKTCAYMTKALRRATFTRTVVLDVS